ncbi:unnamed protein product [Penicillium nalgiovense]|uniref:Uncharacterized protein n=1 Tax=Penicillium nalgiovense TaxID=60175 RepID=A0A1V6Y8C9_PENNA|nr:hypothetical protein PENNAL_c0031G06876 [Penicillium nalgiovense]CAG7944873.1 unnamed protein product [Penicillium nalgiovense]CAG7947681.1 unnamed protein product [Penicillium nalgiovense]CAG7977239.1 unnamed protein product [Penicillium nalgiovense]CAG7977380.1 unnamed protein product [Penicillium nalgiovense]
MSDPSAELTSTLRNLSIGEKGPVQDISRPNLEKLPTAAATSTPKSNPKIPRKPVADSWEDEADLSASEGEDTKPRDEDATPVLSPTISAEGPLGPPSTPISPQTSNPWTARAASPTSAREPPARRPEKQTAVAERMIAGALGIRAPKRTEQQRAYDRSIKEQEIRRRNREREEKAKAKEEEEKMKASMWNS